MSQRDKMSDGVKMIINRQQQNKPQHGFVLILVLVMLAVLTLIGVSSMNSASLELKATANAKQQLVAFNATQSVLEFVASEPTVRLTDWQTINVQLQEQVDSYSLTNTSNLTADVVHLGCTAGFGGSRQAGRGFRYNLFNITASGSNAAGTATSVQVQGVRYPAAGC